MKSSTTTDLLLGHLLDGRYRLLARIGKGGMGAVYSAVQETIERQVAVKLLRADLADDAEMAERFVFEARAVSVLRHPHIVTIHDFGQSPEGLLYMVMELISGESLRKRIERVGPLPPSQALAIAEQICDALVSAHEAGVLHRDLKPDNFMLTRVGGRDDYVKVLDFGIAKLTTAVPSNHTAAGMLVGTPMYMSPEYIRNQPWDQRSDLYALGVVIYEMLSGCHPFAGENPTSVLLAHLEIPFPPLPQITDDGPIGAVLQKATAKNPQDRYQSAREMLAALQDLRATLPADVLSAAGIRRVGVPLDDTPTLPPERAPSLPERLVGPRTQMLARPGAEEVPAGPVAVDLTQPRSRLHIRAPSGASPSAASQDDAVTGTATGTLERGTLERGTLERAAPGKKRRMGVIAALAVLGTAGTAAALYFVLQPQGASQTPRPTATAGAELAARGSATGEARAPLPSRTALAHSDAPPEALPPPQAVGNSSRPAGPTTETTRAVAPISGSPAAGVAVASAAGSAPSPAPKRVKLRLRSKPSGATVYIDDEPRGLTPKVLELPAEARPVSVRFALRGYGEHAESTTLGSDTTVFAKLQRAKPARSQTDATPSRSSARSEAAALPSPAPPSPAPPSPALPAPEPAAEPDPDSKPAPPKRAEKRRKIYGMEFEE